MTENPFNIPDFREEFEATLDKKLAPLVGKVAEHEEFIQKSKGIMAALAALWSAIVVAAEYVFHRH